MPLLPQAPLPDSVLADMQSVYAEIMPDTSTNARTGITVACFINDQPKLLLIERGFRVRSYQIDVPVGSDYVASDILTLGNNEGTFAVEQTLTPLSLPLCLQLIAVPTSLRLASHLAIENATFQHPQQLTKTVAASVFATQRTADMQAYGDVLMYPWLIVYESTVRYEGGGMIGANHRLRLASIFGTDGSGMARAGIISQPRPLLHGLPFMAALVKEPSA